MSIKSSFTSIFIIIFITVCFILYITNSLPSNEIHNIQKLLYNDGIRAYSFFGLLLLLLLIAISFIYTVIYFFLRWVTFYVFCMKNIENIVIVIYCFLITLGCSILVNSFINISSNVFIKLLLNPAIVIGVLIITIFIFRNSKKISINYIIYIMFLYTWLVLFNIFIIGGIF